MSKSSRTSLRSYGKHGTRKNKEAYKKLFKPYDFCCDINDQDNETRYDARKPPFSSSLVVSSPIQESPLLKFRIQSIEPVVKTKSKSMKVKSKVQDLDLDGNPCVKTRGPLLWFQEDELEFAKNRFWTQKQQIYNAKADKNVLIGEKKVKKKLASSLNTAGPRWYQDLSIPQMKQVLALRETMTADCEETITSRTRKSLALIGVTSTFCNVAPQVIRKLQHSTRLEPIHFLREIYRKVAGQYFEEQEYKKTYDCNERIILSAIAFLALPDTVIELNNRLPPICESVLPPKPKPPLTTSTSHGHYKSPYEEPLPLPTNWITYRKVLDEWRAKCKLVPRPRIILPKMKSTKINESQDFEGTEETALDEGIATHSKTNFSDLQEPKQREPSETQINQNQNNKENCKTSFDSYIPTLQGGDKQTFEFTISGLGENPGPVNYKICGTLKPPFPKRKSWLGEKEAHYIISGISEHENPPQCPVTYVMTGISHVTPDNSDTEFLAELKLGDGPRRVYPAGRQHLSKNWQEWLQDADEEFLEVEKEANKLIKSVEATMRLVVPGARCDGCCSCRQTRKTNIKTHATKTPYMMIDSIAESDNQNRYIVGSLALHSPGPSPAESTVNLLEVVASKETIQKKLVINGITNESGETIYYISGVTEEIQYTPKTTVFKDCPPKPLRNVPPCACAIEKIFNEGKIQSISCDDIPHTKNKEICYGQKYRPNESPAFTCKEYPDDKSCRRNPYANKLKRRMFPRISGRTGDANDSAPKEKKMFTLPAFSLCGDEDGMAVCGGPWGTKNIPIPENIAAREAEAKQILRAPPCGSTPGRAVCGGPWGATNLSLKVTKAGEEDDEKEDKEGEEGEKEKLSPRKVAKIAEEVQAEQEKLRKTKLKRDKLCSEKFEDGISDTNQFSTTKEQPVYCELENQWDTMRTAPTVNPWSNEHEKSLKLTQPIPSSHERQIMKKGAHSRMHGSLKQKRKNNDSGSVGDNRGMSENRDKTKNINQGNGIMAKHSVQVIYGAKQTARSVISTNNQQSQGELQGLTRLDTKKTLTISEKIKNSTTGTPKNGRMLISQDIQGQNDNGQFQATKNRSNQAKSDHKSEKGNGRQKKPSIKNDSTNNRHKDSLKKSTRLPRLQCHKQNEAKRQKAKTKDQSPPSDRQDRVFPRKKYEIEPAVIPNEPRIACQREKVYSDNEPHNCECLDEEKVSIEPDRPRYGWRTKSQQELPREKTLVYLAEPDDPVEMIKVKEGGRPCICRQNRNNKKILIYNIGGAVNIEQSRKGSRPPQLIEGVVYVTPPQSPRNSSEYIPEYDLYDSPYKMCARKKSDKDLKYLSKFSTINSLSPGRKNNAEDCPCRNESKENINKYSFPQQALVPKEDRWSSALKNEGLVDYFVSCQDTVPCWLKCAKFSKAGCCEKPRLLQVKKPVCECRYERRVVRREEEKQKWVDRQKRLKAAKKQPYMQVSGTSRPMTQDTKLIISSVKKVLRDGEFIPETQYCVTGVAENYAMGPPQHITPGITMQSPVVTPEPSKSDIVCMCGHRHWSPTDITAGNAQESTLVRAKGEYPCRGRAQKKETFEKPVFNNREMVIADTGKSYEAYHSRADAGGSCSPRLDESKQPMGRKKRKLVGIDRKVTNNAYGNSKKLKFTTEKVSRGLNEKETNEGAEQGNWNKAKEPKHMTMSKTEGSRSKGKQRQHYVEEALSSRNGKPGSTHGADDNTLQLNTSGPENRPDLFDLMKIELEKMASENFVLAKLPECWLIPQLRSWIDYRKGIVYTESFKKELSHLSEKRWDMMRQTRKPSIPLPLLNLRPAETAAMTFDRADEMKKKIFAVQAKYYSELRKVRVSEARWYWPTMEFGRFPNLSFKEAYFTYLAGKEADGHVFRPWNIADSK